MSKGLKVCLKRERIWPWWLHVLSCSISWLHCALNVLRAALSKETLQLQDALHSAPVAHGHTGIMAHMKCQDRLTHVRHCSSHHGSPQRHQSSAQMKIGTRRTWRVEIQRRREDNIPCTLYFQVFHNPQCSAPVKIMFNASHCNWKKQKKTCTE